MLRMIGRIEQETRRPPYGGSYKSREAKLSQAVADRLFSSRRALKYSNKIHPQQ